MTENSQFYGKPHISGEFSRGYNKALDDLLNALPDCDKVDIEHLVSIIERIKARCRE